MGPLLYSPYSANLQALIPDDINLTPFVDDHSLRSSFLPKDKLKINVHYNLNPEWKTLELDE